MKNVKIYFKIFCDTLIKNKFLYSLYILFLIIISAKNIFLVLTLDETLQAIELNHNIVNTNTILLVSFYAITFMFNFINNIVYNKLDQKIELDLWLDINNKLSNTYWIDFEDNKSYKDIEHVNQYANQSYRNIVFSIPDYISLVLQIVFYIILSLRLGTIYVFILLIIITIGLFIKSKLNFKTESLYYKLIPNRKFSKYMTRFPIQADNNAEYKVKRWHTVFSQKIDDSFHKQSDIEAEILYKEKGYNLLIGIFWAVSFSILLIYIYTQFQNSNHLRVFTTAILSFYFLFNSLESFGNNIINDSLSLIDINKYYDYMNKKEMPKLTKFNEDIFELSLNNVDFKYPNSENYALKNINLSVSKGEKIMIIGLNGSGKTTLCTILSGINKSFKGDIKFNDSSINANAFDFTSKVAFMTQEFGQYNLSLEDNIVFGEPYDEKKLEEIMNVLDIKKQFDDIKQELGTMSDLSSNLSKGQWQRIAIVRILMKNSTDIVILDEPTAYLDPIAEIDFYDTISKTLKDKIVFFVSHRLGFAKHTDKILFMEDGKVIAFDTHKDLLEKNEKYLQMYNEQRKWYK